MGDKDYSPEEISAMILSKLKADAEEIDVLLVGIGYSVQTALEAQISLKEKGFKTAVINARFVKPLDEKLLLDWIKRTQLVVTLEENTIRGGFGSAILELMQEKGIKQPALCLGLPDEFIDHASPATQRQSSGIDAVSVVNKIVERFKHKDSVIPSQKRSKTSEVPLVLN
jgi:1-deoxy-D-xylulose-5-phosphate synthase